LNLLAIPAELATEQTLSSLDCSEDTQEVGSWVAGMSTTAAVSGILGGPLGAITGVGVYAVGRTLGTLFNDKIV
jgi:hypothetical protein